MDGSKHTAPRLHFVSPACATHACTHACRRYCPQLHTSSNRLYAFGLAAVAAPALDSQPGLQLCRFEPIALSIRAQRSSCLSLVSRLIRMKGGPVSSFSSSISSWLSLLCWVTVSILPFAATSVCLFFFRWYSVLSQSISTDRVRASTKLFVSRETPVTISAIFTRRRW